MHRLQVLSQGKHLPLLRTKPCSMSQGGSQVLVKGLKTLSEWQVKQLLEFTSLQVAQVSSQGAQVPSGRRTFPSLSSQGGGGETHWPSLVRMLGSTHSVQLVWQGTQSPFSSTISPFLGLHLGFTGTHLPLDSR